MVLGSSAAKQTQLARASCLPSGDREQLRILLAEDNTVNQTLAIHILEKRGHTIVLAETGRQALDILERQSFDLVLMDVQMPEMDGIEATAAIRERERHRGQRIPIIAMTAHAMAGDKQRCLDSGMDGYVSKPIKTKELLDAINKFTPGSRAPIPVPA
jgi:CheY-like chemotaxis protein